MDAVGLLERLGDLTYECGNDGFDVGLVDGTLFLDACCELVIVDRADYRCPAVPLAFELRPFSVALVNFVIRVSKI